MFVADSLLLTNLIVTLMVIHLDPKGPIWTLTLGLGLGLGLVLGLRDPTGPYRLTGFELSYQVSILV